MKTQKITAIAVDDEEHCLDTIKYELKRHCPEVELVATYIDPDSAYEALKDADVDVVFMDINLKSTSGLELLERLAPCNFHIVFTTAYDAYALKAFDLDAVHYLLKPIDGKQLKAALDRIAKLDVSMKLEELANSLKSKIAKSDKIPFPVQSGIEFIDPTQIVYVEGDSNYSILYLHEGRNLVISKTLSHTEEILESYHFLRIHKSYLININYLKSYEKADGGYVVMENEIRLSVSRAKRMLISQLFK